MSLIERGIDYISSFRRFPKIDLSQRAALFALSTAVFGVALLEDYYVNVNPIQKQAEVEADRYSPTQRAVFIEQLLNETLILGNLRAVVDQPIGLSELGVSVVLTGASVALRRSGRGNTR